MAAMFVESALVHSGLVGGMRVIFDNRSIFRFPPELWRLLSSFLLTGGGFSFVFDLYFSTLTLAQLHEMMLTFPVYTYSSGLELNSPRFTQPGDFFTYVLFVATAILVSITTYSFTSHCSFYPVSFLISNTSHICPLSQTSS